MTKTTETMEELKKEGSRFADGYYNDQEDIDAFIEKVWNIARQEGENAGRENVVEGIKAKAEEAVHGLYYVRTELLEALTNPTP